MNYNLCKDVISLLEEFDNANTNHQYSQDINGFQKWVVNNSKKEDYQHDLDWEGKENGRGVDSVISTLLVHMNRFAKSYSRAAIIGSEFSTQEEFIYLINLKAFGEMSKMDLIKKNVQDKPAGILIINRLLQKEWIIQKDSLTDKRSKLISISSKGIEVLEQQMDKIRQATSIVVGNLMHDEKLELLRLLNKLNDFHRDIYEQNVEIDHLLEKAIAFSKRRLST